MPRSLADWSECLVSIGYFPYKRILDNWKQLTTKKYSFVILSVIKVSL